VKHRDRPARACDYLWAVSGAAGPTQAFGYDKYCHELRPLNQLDSTALHPQSLPVVFMMQASTSRSKGELITILDNFRWSSGRRQGQPISRWRSQSAYGIHFLLNGGYLSSLLPDLLAGRDLGRDLPHQDTETGRGLYRKMR
jgi:hypothetical protein